MGDEKKSLAERERARARAREASGWPPSLESGERPRRANTGYALPEESQLRRRCDLEREIEESDSGVPTPRPRLAFQVVPCRAMSDRELLSLPLDHRAGFLLAQIDGKTDLETLIDLSGMPPAEVSALVERLLALGAIVLL